MMCIVQWFNMHLKAGQLSLAYSAQVNRHAWEKRNTAGVYEVNPIGWKVRYGTRSQGQ